MDKKYLEYPAGELLKKFGAGGHKPGSGSAAALQGMLSAQLILTVIDRTLDKLQYSEQKPKLLEIQKSINESIYPELENLFQKDSEQFHKHMVFRLAKKEEKDPFKKRELGKKALVELVRATEIPIEIAKNCHELAGFSLFVFDKAFHAVRGDSGVAMELAISAVGGCVAIVDLNLLSFTSNSWTTSIRKEINGLRAVYNKLSTNSSKNMESLKREVDKHQQYHKAIKAILTNAQKKSRVTNKEIEEIAKNLQNTLWKYRENAWKNKEPKDLLEVLNPQKALSELGYLYNMQTSLGQLTMQGKLFEVAGIIDKKEKIVSISEQFPPAIRNFTSAHELGHALLHKDIVLHRDRPKNGSSSTERNIKEKQADKFASYFLMPENLLKPAFLERFLSDRFVINEESAFAFNESSTSSLRKKSRNKNGLAKKLAGAEFYNGNPFVSLAGLFKVSIDAMAIRLEELGLLEY